MLHGGLGHSGNWGHQVGPLCDAGYRVILVDTRGHGRSTRDARPFTYQLLASDVLAVTDAFGLERVALVGWSDGACTALVLAMQAPARANGVFFFACNMDPSGARPIERGVTLQRCFARHARDYAELSETPGDFHAFSKAVGEMQVSQPNATASELARIDVPVTVALGENDEFITREHAEYLAETIPGAGFVLLEGVSHFAPLQRPALFNSVLLQFLGRVLEPAKPQPGAQA
jgi:pimeloyl-ACP methyl ester carboxylesterase